MKIQKLIKYLQQKNIEAVQKNYFLYGIMERDGIVVVDFKTKTFSPAQGDGNCETLDETMNNLLQLGYKYDDNFETNPAIRWWDDFITIEPQAIEVSPDVEASKLRATGFVKELY